MTNIMRVEGGCDVLPPPSSNRIFSAHKQLTYLADLKLAMVTIRHTSIH